MHVFLQHTKYYYNCIRDKYNPGWFEGVFGNEGDQLKSQELLGKPERMHRCDPCEFYEPSPHSRTNICTTTSRTHTTERVRVISPSSHLGSLLDWHLKATQSTQQCTEQNAETPISLFKPFTGSCTA